MMTVLHRDISKNSRAGLPALFDGEVVETGLEVAGEDEFFCKNFLLISEALNFFGCGAERLATLVGPDERAVTIVGSEVVLDSDAGIEAASALSPASRFVCSGALSGTAATDTPSELPPNDFATSVTSL